MKLRIVEKDDNGVSHPVEEQYISQDEFLDRLEHSQQIRREQAEAIVQTVRELLSECPIVETPFGEYRIIQVPAKKIKVLGKDEYRMIPARKYIRVVASKLMREENFLDKK